MRREILMQNTKVAANAIQVCNATIHELTGKCLDGAEAKELEEAFAVELNNLVMENAQ